jgi:regulator of sigma E protease
MYIAGFLLLLGPLITLHELGHYWVGRWFGVKADAFSIGFGKELAGFTDRRGTRWKLAVLPLGGYVQFAGDMNPTSQPSHEWLDLPAEERAKTFQSKPLWQRALIVAAGPLTNLLLAVVIVAGFALAFGRPVGVPQVAGFAPQSDARAAGVVLGDTILAIDGHEIDSFSEVPERVAIRGGHTVRLTVERDGQHLQIPVKLRRQVFRDEFGNQSQGADLGIDFVPARVGGVLARSPAAKAGLKTGDVIVAVDRTKVNGFEDLAAMLAHMPGKAVSVSVLRDGQSLDLPVQLDSVPAKNADGKTIRVGMLGVGAGYGKLVPVSLPEAVAIAWRQSVDTIAMEAEGLGQILTGNRPVKELGGPLRIAKFSGEQLSLGWRNFVSFVALISINLAFINLLPIPALDGGHLAFYAAEAVRRKPASPRSQEWAFRTGIAFVLALMLFVTINDIVSLPIFGS